MHTQLRRGGVIAGALLASVISSSPALAAIVGGGGSPRIDCLAVFDIPANFPPGQPRNIRCTDGDPACDLDATVDGQCQFPVAMCANSSFDAQHCSPATLQSITIDHAEDTNDPKFDTDFQALQSAVDSQIEPPTSTQDACTTPITIRVRVDGPFPGQRCRNRTKVVKVTTVTTAVQGQVKTDTDILRLRCDPQTVCDPVDLFDGTLDRIERQIFTERCALGGCHNSNASAGGLLLEPGVSYAQTVDQDPDNGVAFGFGWKRIDAANQSLDTSFLFRKIKGDLPPGTGERMPRGRPKLSSYLIDVIRLWIEDGAPATGWSPGTDD